MLFCMKEFFDSSMVIAAETVKFSLIRFEGYTYIVNRIALWILLSICHAEIS